ncbi:MAG: hypothetical protein HKP09_04615 [Enterobacterales bacterium]|nr:hypothetical protein [Enterobacterales bacterium]
MKTPHILERLKHAGYSNKDIIDLVTIFLNQLAIFEFSSDKDVFLEQVHKLKGGLSLLCLVEEREELEMIEADQNKSLSLSLKPDLQHFISKLQADLELLLTNL